jgi:hypothetical protein
MWSRVHDATVMNEKNVCEYANTILGRKGSPSNFPHIVFCVDGPRAFTKMSDGITFMPQRWMIPACIAYTTAFARRAFDAFFSFPRRVARKVRSRSFVRFSNIIVASTTR